MQVFLVMAARSSQKLNSDFYLAVDTVSPVMLLAYGVISAILQSSSEEAVKRLVNPKVAERVRAIKRARDDKDLRRTRVYGLALAGIVIKLGWNLALYQAVWVVPVCSGTAICLSTIALLTRNGSGLLEGVTASQFFLAIVSIVAILAVTTLAEFERFGLAFSQRWIEEMRKAFPDLETQSGNTGDSPQDTLNSNTSPTSGTPQETDPS